MITVKRVKDEHECYCHSCIAQEKPHYRDLVFYTIRIGRGSDTIVRLCDECACQLAVRIIDLEQDNNHDET